MSRLLLSALVIGVFPAIQAWAADTPADTVRQADEVLGEIMAIPAKAIPERLLSEARGVVIVPDVIKIGFIAGARRGYGVVMVRDAEGEWSLPQFVTLTGGSVGWQAGLEGSDVVLVFTTQKGVQDLLRGKFTIGANAAAAAGPVGRNAAAATDASLKAEIYSYSRSRGLFLGVSIDGSALEIDNAAHFAFYGSQSSELPRVVPQVASQLRQDLVSLTPSAQSLAPSPAAAGAVRPNPARLQGLRTALDQSSRRLLALVSPEWQRYLVMPNEIYSGSTPPSLDAMKHIAARYEQLAQGADYKALAARPEFQSTQELVREFTAELSAESVSSLQLPPPPTIVK